MAIEHTLTGNGELKESETIMNEETFSEEQIDDKIVALGNEMAGLQTELTVWQGRKTKLTELQAQ